ncbi:alpha/beta hydrolase [Kingella oralis]|uniref:alpha/beta hydrolase n=2 Tax=Kingella oralis TaxID=505 RepID=UPI0034E40A07
MDTPNPPAQPAYTQPAPPKAPPADITRRANPAILTAPHTRYTFHTLNLPRTNGETQRIFVGIPHTPPPAQGYPALYALDGNALLELLPPQTLSQYRHPPVLVLIGYPTDLRFDTARRAYDYTPPNADGEPIPDPLTTGRQNGGAPELLQFIETQLRPRIAQLAPTDSGQQTLWGHSYGGLFVLYTLFERPELFSHYIAADPSLWWHNGLMLHYAARARIIPNRHLILQKSGASLPQKANPAHINLPADAAQQLAEQLRQRGIATEYRHYPKQTHGGLLAQSFQEWLDSIQ